MRNPASILRPALAALAAAAVLSACDLESRADVEIVGMQPGVSRQQYLAMPDSVRLEQEKDAVPGEAQGVAVEVLLKIDGYKGQTIPLAYTLHDARNGLPFVSRKVPVAPDADQWSTRGQLWLPVIAAGTYYVQVVLGDSTGRKTVGPRTDDFTIR